VDAKSGGADEALTIVAKYAIAAGVLSFASSLD
jgi:hypothetical protein